MNKKSLRATAGLSAALALIATSGFAAPSASAENPDIASATVSSASQSSAASYWTPQRLQNARPGDDLLLGRTLGAASDLAGKVAVGVPQVVQGRQASGGLLGGILGGDGSRGSVYTGGGQVVKTTGKVFFTLGRTNYQCSGSSVRADNKDLVLTAGHCINEGPGKFVTNFIFIPAYKNGSAPYGKFAARRLATTKQWQNAGDLNYDVGFAVVGRSGGKDLADRVGSQGIAFNQPRGQFMHSFGYPAESPYSGGSLAWCRGTVVSDSVGGSSDQGMTCNMTGGSSGGPWFLKYNESTGIGLTNSLNSFKYEILLFGGDKMYGPYFGSAAQSVYNSAKRM